MRYSIAVLLVVFSACNQVQNNFESGAVAQGVAESPSLLTVNPVMGAHVVHTYYCLTNNVPMNLIPAEYFVALYDNGVKQVACEGQHIGTSYFSMPGSEGYKSTPCTFNDGFRNVTMTGKEEDDNWEVTIGFSDSPSYHLNESECKSQDW